MAERTTVPPAQRCSWYIVGVLGLVLTLANPAVAQTTEAPQAPGAAGHREAQSVEEPGKSESDDFELFSQEEVAPPAVEVDEAFTRRVDLRRRMLSTHQLMGLTTLTLMLATTVVGVLNYQDVYAPDRAGTGHYLRPHRILAYTTTLSFATTGSLAVFAPESYKKHKGFDTATVHKMAVSGATLGMLTQVALGFVAARTQEAGNPADMSRIARVHRLSGFVTTSLLATAATVWIF